MPSEQNSENNQGNNLPSGSNNNNNSEITQENNTVRQEENSQENLEEEFDNMSSKIKLEKLTGAENYMTWRNQVDFYLGIKKMKDAISKDATKRSAFEKDNKNDEAVSLIMLTIQCELWDNILLDILEEERTVYKILNKLDDQYQRKCKGVQGSIMKEIGNLKLKDCKNMQEYLNKMAQLFKRSSLAGNTYASQGPFKSSMIQMGLGEEFEPLIAGLAGAAKGEDIDYEILVKALTNCNSKVQYKKEKETAASYSAQRGGNNGQRGHGRGRGGRFRGRGGRSQSNGNQKNFNGNNDKNYDRNDNNENYQHNRNNFKKNNCQNNQSQMRKQCYNCKSFDHLSRNCPKNQGASQSVCYADQEDETYNSDKKFLGHFSSLANRAHVSLYGDKNSWFVDSGASVHMTPHKSNLNNMKHASGSITAANNAALPIIGCGDTKLKLKEEMKMKNVSYVPDLGVNLMSVGELTKEGKTVVFQGNECRIYSEKFDLITRVKKTNGTYRMKAETCMNSVKQRDTLIEWHRKLGHPSLKKMKQLNFIDGIKFSGDEQAILNCRVCCEGKQTRSKIPKKADERATEILELVHSDVAGPVPHAAAGGFTYVCIFVDDYSRKNFVYLLREKSEVFEKFKEFKARAEKETGRKLKTIRTDNGGEYTSKEWREFCVNEGIQHQLTAPHSSFQNGVAERFIRTLRDKTKCLLFDANLPLKGFWGYATLHASLLINNIPSSVHGKKPEVWNGKTVNLEKLRRFGSTLMVKNLTNHKWDKNAEENYYMGLARDHKAVLCVNKKTRKLTVSRDIRLIDEDNFEINLLETDTEDENTENKNNTMKSHPNEADTSNEYLADDYLTTDDVTDDDDSQTNMQSIVAPTPATTTSKRINKVILPTTRVTRSQTRNNSSSTALPPSHFFNQAKLALCTAFNAHNNIPNTYEEVLTNKDKNYWIAAMNEEMNSQIKNKTWKLVQLPNGKSALKGRWVFQN